MINKPFDAVSLLDIQGIVAAQVTEDRNLEFKAALPGRSETDAKEFLADVTSLANAQGGDLIFGVSDIAGAASAAPGVEVQDADAEILRLENILRDGVEPRLSGMRTKWLPISAGRGVVVMRIPASLMAPHRVKFQRSNRFYTRNSRGKYEMDTHELRLAFNASEQTPARFRALQTAAVAAAEGTDMPFGIDDVPMAVASVAPLSLFRDVREIDMTPENAIMPPRGSGGLTWRHTLEGVLWHTPPNERDTIRSYALTHRRGSVEAAWTIGGTREVGNKVEKFVWSDAFERGLLDLAGTTASRLSALGVEGPWVVLTTILRIKGFQLAPSQLERSEPSYRGAATLPEVVAERLDPASLAPIFQAFWRVFGFIRP